MSSNSTSCALCDVFYVIVVAHAVHDADADAEMMLVLMLVMMLLLVMLFMMLR